MESAGSFTFKATDPERVTAKLEKQHAAWTRTLEDAKRKAEEALAERKLASVGKGGKDPSAAMEVCILLYYCSSSSFLSSSLFLFVMSLSYPCIVPCFHSHL